MFKDSYKVVGVMSGTSLDGVDCAFVKLSRSPNGHWDYQFIQTSTVPYHAHWQDRLRHCSLLSQKEVNLLDKEFTLYLSDLLHDFISALPEKPDLVCSHGHTVWHRPELGYTLQIGQGEVMAKRLGITVISDFRTQDVELGGQGAPLVPIGDRLLFGQYDYCLNLGGFANCSMEVDGQRIAYDICPINILLNRYAQELGSEYDHGGKLAETGHLNKELLLQLDRISYYDQTPPKSLGAEWVAREMDPLLISYKIPVRDKLRTLVEHMAGQIARSIPEKSTLLITGGGAYNDFLIDQLQGKIQGRIQLPARDLIEYKEALVFALLGVLRMRHEINCLASVTGASKDHSSGKLFLPD